jgi:HlyD family secretion protein
MSKRLLVGILVAVVVAVGALPLPQIHSQSAVFRLLLPTAQARSRVRDFIARLRGQTLPEGIARTNGRIEATQVDVSAKYPGRLTEITVEEGTPVTEGQVLGRVSSPETEAKLRAAKAEVERATHAKANAEALISERTAILNAAKSDFERGKELVTQKIITQQTFDQRQRNFESAAASVTGANAQRDSADAAIRSSEAEVERLQAVLKDMTLASPRAGRIQYQLARNGEVIAMGGRVFTVLDLHDVYMTVFFPASVAGRLEIGGEARVVLDPVPQYIIPATVTFVATDAQFTPKTVETADEREKLMFRVKLNIDPAVLKEFASRVKTGVRGLGFVRTARATPWPDNLQVKLPQ